MNQEIDFLKDFFNDILKKLEEKIKEQDCLELYNTYNYCLQELNHIFKKEKEVERESLDSDDFELLRSMIFIKGSTSYHENIKDLIGYYISNYRILPSLRKYVKYEDIEADILQVVEKEKDRLKELLINKNLLEEYQKSLQNIIDLINDKKYIGIETSKLFEIISSVKEIDSDVKTNLLISLLDYNSEVLKITDENKKESEEKLETKIEAKQKEIVEKKKVKSVRNIKKKEESKKKKETKIEEVIEELQEEVEILEDKEPLKDISLTKDAQGIFDTIKSMLISMDKDEVLLYLNDISIWGKSYLEEIKKYCEVKKINDDILALINEVIKEESEEKQDENEALLIFKGFDETTSVVEKDLRSLKDNNHIESVKIYLEELKRKEINFAYEAFHGGGELKGSYHKKSRKAVRLSYEILGDGIYYVYDITVKKSDNDKASKEKIINRRPNEQEVKRIKELLTDEEKRIDVIAKNEEIYNNIMSYIEEQLPDLKDKNVR